MNDIPDSALLAALRRQMATAVQKQTIAASNLANLDTPGYRTREVSFADTLEDQMARPAATHPKHLGALTHDERGGSEVKEVEGLQGRRDGNNVQLEREMLAMTGAAGDFSKAQTALAAKFRLVRYAINEGR